MTGAEWCSCDGCVMLTLPLGCLSWKVKYTLRFNQSLGQADHSHRAGCDGHDDTRSQPGYDPNLPSVAAVFRSTKLTTQGLVEPQKDL